MHQHGKRIDRLGIDEDRHFHKIARPVAGNRIIETRIAFRDRLQPVVEIEHDFIERQIIGNHRPLADIVQIGLHPAPFLAEFEHRAEIIIGRQYGRADPRFLDRLDLGWIRQISRIVEFEGLAIPQHDPIDDRRRRRDEIEIEFALQPLLNDFKMQKTQKAAAEAKAERRRTLHFIGEARVIQPQTPHGGAQIGKIRRVDREKPAKNHGLRGLESRQGLGARVARIGDRVADPAYRRPP